MTSRKRLVFSYCSLSLLLTVLFAVSLFWGSVALSPADIAALMIHLERPQGGEGAGPCPAKSQEKETL